MIRIIFHSFPLKHMFENHIDHVYLFLQVMCVMCVIPMPAEV